MEELDMYLILLNGKKFQLEKWWRDKKNETEPIEMSS